MCPCEQTFCAASSAHKSPLNNCNWIRFAVIEMMSRSTQVRIFPMMLSAVVWFFRCECDRTVTVSPKTNNNSRRVNSGCSLLRVTVVDVCSMPLSYEPRGCVSESPGFCLSSLGVKIALFGIFNFFLPLYQFVALIRNFKTCLLKSPRALELKPPKKVGKPRKDKNSKDDHRGWL